MTRHELKEIRFADYREAEKASQGLDLLVFRNDQQQYQLIDELDAVDGGIVTPCEYRHELSKLRKKMDTEILGPKEAGKISDAMDSLEEFFENN